MTSLFEKKQKTKRKESIEGTVAKKFFDDTPIVLKVSSNRNPNSAISKEFLEYYAERYETSFGVPAKIEWGKDIKLINKLLRIYEDVSVFSCESKLEFLVKACEKYFISRDNLALKSAWSIGVFYCSFSKIVLLLKNKENSNIEPITEGYKLAILNATGVKYNDIITEHDEEVFVQLYLLLKPLWVKSFSLTRFTELFFLVLFDHMRNKDYNLNFFISKYAIDFFTKWLETEGKDILMFWPKDIVEMGKGRLEMEQQLMLEEERKLFYGSKI